MKNLFFIFALLFSSILPMQVKAANERGNAEEAVALVKKGMAAIKANGTEAAYAAISDNKGPFVDRDLYLFVFDATGKTLAHGANPKLIGKNLIEMKDSDGKYFIKDFLTVADKKGKGWVDYKWPHPISKEIEHKSTYIERLENGSIIGCGIYK